MDNSILINAALGILGQSRMANTAEPNSELEREAVAVVDQVRREILQKQKWTSATEWGKVQPEPDAVVPPNFSYVGTLPAAWLKCWEVGADNYTVLARRKIAWAGPAVLLLEFAANIEPAQLDPLLINAISHRLAARIVPKQRDRTSDLETYNKLALNAELEAAGSDAMNRREEPLLSSNWLLASQRGPGWME
jgi:hypothetical protein